MTIFLCKNGHMQGVKMHGPSAIDSYSTLAHRKCNQCETLLQEVRTPCLVRNSDRSLCGNSVPLPLFPVPREAIYVCPTHVSALIEVFKKLGRAGEGPNHMPGCSATYQHGPIMRFTDYERQVNHLWDFAEQLAFFFTIDVTVAHRLHSGSCREFDIDLLRTDGLPQLWRTQCCQRPFSLLRIENQAYSLNYAQLQGNDVEVEHLLH